MKKQTKSNRPKLKSRAHQAYENAFEILERSGSHFVLVVQGAESGDHLGMVGPSSTILGMAKLIELRVMDEITTFRLAKD